MDIFKYLLITVISIILTVVLIIGIYLHANIFVGNIVLILGLISLFIVLIITIIGLVVGEIKIIRWKGRKKLYFVIPYIIVTTTLLIVVYFFNFVIINEMGELSRSEKLNLMLGKSVLDEKVIQQTEDYPVLKYKHITFKYHPTAETEVKKIISQMDDVEWLEKQIFGHELSKDDKLEMFIFPNQEVYKQSHYLAFETEGGRYFKDSKSAIMYMTGKESDDQFVSIFFHEYGHYLLDLFVTENGIKESEIPIWFSEGVSEFIKYQMVGDLYRIGYADDKFKFNEIQTSSEWVNAVGQTDAYYLAGTAIKYVAESQQTLRILTDILLEQKKTDSFKDSFEGLTGLKLETLHADMFLVEEDLEKADRARLETDFETAEIMYKKVTKEHPLNALAWHQYANMLQDQKRWDEALVARRKVISIEPKRPIALLNLSYLLTVIDRKEAVETAELAVKLTKDESDYDLKYAKKWLDEITQYEILMGEGNYKEAIKVLKKSEQLAAYPSILEYVKGNSK